jgi:hypothetical protein
MPPPAKNSRKVSRLSHIDDKLKQNDDSRNALPVERTLTSRAATLIRVAEKEA